MLILALSAFLTIVDTSIAKNKRCTSSKYCPPGYRCLGKESATCIKLVGLNETCKVVTKAKFGHNCMNGLQCFNISGVRTCRLLWGDNLEKLAAEIVKNYTGTFQHYVESNLTHNVQQLGSPVITGTHAAGIIPEDEQGRKAGINDYVTQQFANDVTPQFMDIARNGINEIFSGFIANTKADTPASQLETKRNEISKSLFDEVYKRLGNFVDESWTKFTEKLNGDFEKAKT